MYTELVIATLQKELKEAREAIQKKDDIFTFFSILRLAEKLNRLGERTNLTQQEYKQLYWALETARSDDYEGLVKQGHMTLRLILAIKLATNREIKVYQNDVALAGRDSREYLANENFYQLAGLKYVCDRLKVRFPLAFNKDLETRLNHELNKVKASGEF